MGFVWKEKLVKPWEAKLVALNNYQERNGDTVVPFRYVDESSGFKLGRWVNNLRSGHLSPSNTQQNDLDSLRVVWIPKRGPRPKPLVHEVVFVDAAAATMTTKVARKKKEVTTYSELNQHLGNAALIAVAPNTVTSRSNNSCSSSTVIDHHNKAEDTDDDGKRADMSTCVGNRASSRLLEFDAMIMKLQAEIKYLEAKSK
jgi:hypothetical protein